MTRILVVEDHRVTQRLLVQRLQKAGYEVMTAVEGQEALARLESTPCDLIVSDIAMPIMDGLTLLRRVRENPATQSIPFIVLTTSVLDEHRKEAENAGANGFLEKPVSSWELVEMVHQLLGQT